MSTERPWLESLVACIPDPLALVGADGRFVWANREFAAAVGSTAGLKGEPVASFFPEWDAVVARLEALAPGARAALDARLTPTNGEPLDVELHAARCLPGVGAAWALYVRRAADVQELQRRLGERERSHSFLQAHTSDLIVRTDADGRIAWRNESAAAYFALGVALGEVLDDASNAALASGDGDRFEVTLRAANGAPTTFLLSGFVRRLVDGDGAPSGLSLLLRDETDSDRLERFADEHALSPREREIIEYLVRGYSNLNIATILGLSESGVKFHIRNVFSRAKVSTRTELMALLLERE